MSCNMARSENDTTFSEELYHLSFDSVEEDSNTPWFSLIQNLSENQMKTLKKQFYEIHPGGKLTREEFLNTICTIYGNSKYSLQSTLLFEEIEAKNNTGEISWGEFLDFLIENLNPKTPKTVNLQISSIEAVPHTKRETIVKVVLVEMEKYFCYAIVSKHGRIGLYDGNLNFLTSYHVIMTREDIKRSENERRRRSRWVTDAIFCPDIQMFIVSNTTRSIMIYEASGLHHIPSFLIVSTPSIVQCLVYKPQEKNSKTGCNLYMGDNFGELIEFRFLQPKVGLLRKKHNDRMSLFYWAELPNEKEFVTLTFLGKFHKNSIYNMQYFHEKSKLVTCSTDSNASVVKINVDNKKKSQIFKFPRGATTFALSYILKTLITGSDDGIVRIWNLLLITKPTAILTEHTTGIVDIQIMEKQELFLSISRDGVLKLWKFKDEKCLQTIKIKFPSFEVLGKTIEWGKNCIYPGPKRLSKEPIEDPNSLTGEKCLINEKTERKATNEPKITCCEDHWERSNILITCCNYLANVRVNFYEDDGREKYLKTPVLPPPPLQNSVLIPESWRIPNPNNTTELNTAKSSCELNGEGVNIEKTMENFKFILDKNLLEPFGLNSNINYKISLLEQKKLEMQQNVAQGAPYLALDIYDIEELKLSKNLPVPNKKKIKNLIEKTQQLLDNATLKDQIFSEPSSSTRSKSSSKSSIVEFPF